MKILRALLHGAYSAEHDVGGQHDPFLQVKLLRLLRTLGKGDAEASDAMSDALANVASNESRSSKNAGAAVLYEAVRCAVGVESVGGLRVLAVNVLGRFLADKDNNVRYVALNALAKVVGNDAQAVQRHRRTIVECVKDGDVTIRRSALNLVYSLVNAGNVETLAPELLEYLAVADPEFKSDVATKIARLSTTFAPSDRWRIDTFVQTLLRGGSHVAREECRSFVALLTNRVALQPYATRALFRAAHDAAFDDAHAPLVAVACWALGEYGDDVYQNRLPDEPPLARSPRATSSTRSSRCFGTRARARHAESRGDGARETRRARSRVEERLRRRGRGVREARWTSRCSRGAWSSRGRSRRGADVAAAALERMPPMAMRDEVGASRRRRCDVSRRGGGAGRQPRRRPARGPARARTGGGRRRPRWPRARTFSGTSSERATGGSLGSLGSLGGLGGAPVFPSSHGAARAVAADPLAELMGGSPSPFAPGVPPPDPLADLMGGVGDAFAHPAAFADPSSGPAADLLGSPAAPGGGAPPAAPGGAGAPAAVVVPALDAHGVRVSFSCAKPNDSDASATTITASYANANAFAVSRSRAARRGAQVGDARARTRVGRRSRAERGVATQVLNVVNPLVDSKPLAMRLQVTWREAGEERAEMATVTFPSGV